MHKGKIIAQKPLFESSFFTITENTIDYGDFMKVHQDVYRHPAVSIFPLTDLHEIYLIKQHRYLYNTILLEAIAGVMEDGEEPLVTAKRELMEESGIQAGNMKIIKEVYVAGSFIHAKQYLILARDLTFREAHPEETESIELVKMSLDEAVEKVMQGEIETASSSIGILLVNELVKRGEI